MVSILVSASAVVAGPVSKGNEVYSGAISYSSAGGSYYENATGDRTHEFIMTPGGGLFLRDGLAVNVILEGRWFSHGGVRDDYYSIGPRLEYYWDTTGGEDAKGHWLPHVGLAYLWGRAELESPDSLEKFNTGMTSMSVGVDHMLTDHVAGTLTINYRVGHYNRTDSGEGANLKANRWIVLLGIKAFVD